MSGEKSLDEIKNEDAKSFYLRAIIGSRSANTEMVIENLQSAFENDASLKEYAKKDREFIKYFENATVLAKLATMIPHDLCLYSRSSKVGREHRSHVREHLFAFAVRKYRSV